MSDPSLADYVEDLFGSEDEQLKAMRLEAEREGIPTIQVPFELGRLLQILIVQSGARQILEIGTLFGYSTVLMARALPQNGRITSLEVSPKHADIARRNVETAHLSDRAEIVLGPAAESLSGLPASSFDLVFIDADKRSYP
ncbi:MAG TPA: class I SAM-dependent methyltransferase, partial [Chloroflexota bacterium]